MSLEQVAALVCTTLDRHGIRVVLSGGAVVSIYSEDEYLSCDLDFVPTGLAPKVDRQCLEQAIQVACRHPVDLPHIERWADTERPHGAERFREFAQRLREAAGAEGSGR